MAYIILADQRNHNTIREATSYLMQRGHRVDLTADGLELMALVSREQPEVVVLSFFLSNMDGLQAAQDIHKLNSDSNTQLLWITLLAPDGGGPAFTWKPDTFSNAILEPFTAWQLVLAVEQLIYRQIKPKHEPDAI